MAQSADGTEIEAVMRIKKHGIVISEWTFREGQGVEVVNFFPSGQIEERATVSVTELLEALHTRFKS